jgi:hypothetical protein
LHYAPWGYGNIKVLSVKSTDGNSKISAGKTYNPSWAGSFLYYTTFQIQQNECSAFPIDITTRNVDVEIGYDEINSCTFTISDGPISDATITRKSCKTSESESLTIDSLTSSGESISKGQSLREYYLNIKHVGLRKLPIIR